MALAGWVFKTQKEEGNLGRNRSRRRSWGARIEGVEVGRSGFQFKGGADWQIERDGNRESLDSGLLTGRNTQEKLMRFKQGGTWSDVFINREGQEKYWRGKGLNEEERARARNTERERKELFVKSRTVKASRPCLLLYRNEWKNRRKTLVR